MKKIEILWDGTDYTLNPTFEALSRIEKELATGIMALARKLCEGTVTLEELAVIITECLMPKMPSDFIQDALLRNGLSPAMEAVISMFALIFAGLYSRDFPEPAITRHELNTLMRHFPDTPKG